MWCDSCLQSLTHSPNGCVAQVNAGLIFRKASNLAFASTHSYIEGYNMPLVAYNMPHPSSNPHHLSSTHLHYAFTVFADSAKTSRLTERVIPPANAHTAIAILPVLSHITVQYLPGTSTSPNLFTY